MSAAYTNYAPFYDNSGQMRFAVLTSYYLSDLLAHHPVGGKRALDLACGTGTLAILLAEEGWQVVGVDQSAAMLAVARQKTATDQPHFVEADLRSFMRHTDTQLQNAHFDLVTCFYDSLNYLLSETDLAACFAQVALTLAPGGLFVFDLNTDYFLEHDWEPAIVLENPGFVQVQQSVFDPHTRSSTMVVTGFVGDDERGYQRFDEVHTERAYPPATISRLLAEAGLIVEAMYDCFTRQPPYPHSQRIAWLARTPV